MKMNKIEIEIMKYIVSRISDYYGQEKPCEESFKYPHERWDERVFDEKEFNKRFSDTQGVWRSKGKNHSITDRETIIRQLDDVIEWTIEINSLDELNDFSKKYGDLILIPEPHERRSPKIMIYDDVI